MKLILAGIMFVVEKAPRHKANYATIHAQIKGMKPEDTLDFLDHAHKRCSMADALVKGARKNGIHIKTSHKDGKLVVRRTE